LLLVGAGYQLGALPLPAHAIEEAIRVNGVAVDANIQAFRRGRQLVCDPAGIERVRAPRASVTPSVASSVAWDLTRVVACPPGSELERLVAVRTQELVAYQDRAYARRFVDVVEQVRGLEAERVPGSTLLAEAVARHLFKLMAYKDEYEVARLSLGDDLTHALEEQFGAGIRASWKLHPPVLRALGMHRKVTLGPWFRPAFKGLYAARHLRGTRVDPFGWTDVRRTERQLVDEYTSVVAHLARHVQHANVALAAEIANLPDIVRGYEDVKMRNVATYREKLKQLRDRFDAQL
jgi:indolepyruvate ferredoxin oxidoreductase